MNSRTTGDKSGYTPLSREVTATFHSRLDIRRAYRRPPGTIQAVRSQHTSPGRPWPARSDDRTGRLQNHSDSDRSAALQTVSQTWRYTHHSIPRNCRVQRDNWAASPLLAEI